MAYTFKKVRVIIVFLILCLLLGAKRTKAVSTEITDIVELKVSETVNHHITILSGGKLIIKPGVTLTFQEIPEQPFKITVQTGGYLEIGGEGNVARVDTDGITRVSGWDGIENYGTVTIRNAEIKRAGYGVYNHGGELKVGESTFSECGYAIRSDGGIVELLGNNFIANNHAIELTNVSSAKTAQICGNTFHLDNNQYAIRLAGTNNVNIRYNNFSDGNQTSIDLLKGSNNSQVYISYNNFFHNRTFYELPLNTFYIIRNEGSPVGVYNCYWSNNGTSYTSVNTIKEAKLIGPDSNAIPIFAPLAIQVDNIEQDLTPPQLVDVSPEKSTTGIVDLTVVIQDDGWGVDPSTVEILVGGNKASLSSYTYNSRQYIFQAKINITSAGDYSWSVSATDLAGNTMNNQNLGRTLKITNDLYTQVTVPAEWRNFSEGDYNLVTIPVFPNEKDHRIALKLDAPGSTVVRWDPVKNAYIYYGDSNLETFEPGKGFWVRFGTGEDFGYDPIKNQNTDICILGKAQEDYLKEHNDNISYKLMSLTNGWHLIGAPFLRVAGQTMPLNRITFRYESGSHSFLDAVRNDYIGFGLWTYDASGYKLERESMKAWKGYWIYVKKPCEILLWKNDPPLPLPNFNLAWEAQLTVSQAEASDSANYFGMARSVAVGVDHFDAVKPPTLNSTLQSYFVVPGANQGLGGDYRPTNIGNQTWEYAVKGLRPGEAWLSWDGLSQVPQHYQIKLKDLQSGQEVDLRRSNAYVFQVSGETERRFAIQLVDQGAPALQLTNLRLSRNPFAPRRETEVITFNVNAAATIDIKFYDWVGNLVYVNPPLTAWSATEIQCNWNGRNNRGQPVANGVYFCKISARSGNATATQTLKLAVVN